MTALAAYFSLGQENSERACQTMLQAQAIYGKETACNTLGHAALGRRLWPLTPEDAFDAGPLCSEDRQLLFCADVRLDNREELAEQIGVGELLNGLSDADVVFRAYRKWGDEAFAMFYGAFAVIIWDATSQMLKLVRDPLGERPLHYHIGDDFVAVASMPKGLHGLHQIPYAARPDAMADFLALMPETGSESFFEGVERVLPGHVATIDAQGAVTSKAYWHAPTDYLQLSNDAEYEEIFRKTFDEAVGCRLRRIATPIGCHLSAGLDSSSVTATAAKLLSPETLHAFTSVPVADVKILPGKLVDEGPLASDTARLYANVDHIKITTGGVSPLEGLDRHFQLYERPVMNICNAVWDAAINDAAKAKGITVMLSGAMGNMTISYTGVQQLNHLLRRVAFPSLIKLMIQMYKRGRGWKWMLGQLFGPYMPGKLWQWIEQKYGQSQEFNLYSALRPEALDSFAVKKRAKARGLDLTYRPWRDGRAMRLWVLSRVDLGVYYKGTLAGWGIDMRDPTSDRRLVELTLRIPDRQYILDGESRSLVRRAFADRLPATVIKEQRTGRQAADWYLGMSSAHASVGAELVAFERNRHARSLIDIERLKKAHKDWPNIDPTVEKNNMLYRLAMYRSVAAGHFLRKVGRTN
jgi:asparagine synthase (glutamine-hydrolysing)